MTKYEGLPCTHCGEKFQKNSDVVVCPHCGAPYHRSCYKELGQCAFKDKHGTGFAWEIPIEELPPERVTICLKCKTPNPKENTFCKKCGNKLDENVKVVSILKIDESEIEKKPFLASLSNDEADEYLGGVTEKEISAYVGNNAFYFLKRFRLLLTTSSGWSWNWPAFFFKFIYFFYRKMYKIGALLLLFSIMLTVPSMLYSIELFKANSLQILGVELAYNKVLLDNLATFIPIINTLNAIYSLLCGMFANKIFMSKALNDIKIVQNAMGKDTTPNQYYTALSAVGRPDKISVWIFVALFLTVYVKIVTGLTTLLP